MEHNGKKKIRQFFENHPFVAFLKNEEDAEKFLRYLDSLGFRCRDGRPCIELRHRGYDGAYFVYVRKGITWAHSYVCRDIYPTVTRGAKSSIRFIKDTVSKLCT